MNINNLKNDFLELVPELKCDYEEQKEINYLDDSDGNYIIWGMGLMPGIIKLLSDLDMNKNVLERVFVFLEMMANSDEEIKELLMYGILERLGDCKQVLEKSKSLMGPKTLKCSQDIEKFLGRVFNE